MKNVSVALIQHECTQKTNDNLAKSCASIRSAAAQGAQLIVLQELHRSLYFCQQEDTRNFDLAEPIPGPSTEAFGTLAGELEIVIVASLFERRAAGIYHNTAVVLDSDGSIAGKYRKMHIPDDPGFYEKFYFTPGDLGFTPINTSLGKLGVLVCWDQWFPEAARMMCLAGAELLIYPTAIGWDPSDTKEEKSRQLDAWITVQRAHAIANGVPVVSVNRAGFEADPGNGPGIEFWGNSFASGPQGEFLSHIKHTNEALSVVNIDLEKGENIRRIWPYFRDRRIDHYGDLLKIYRDD